MSVGHMHTDIVLKYVSLETIENKHKRMGETKKENNEIRDQPVEETPIHLWQSSQLLLRCSQLLHRKRRMASSV